MESNKQLAPVKITGHKMLNTVLEMETKSSNVYLSEEQYAANLLQSGDNNVVNK